jgi:hypothetical protein
MGTYDEVEGILDPYGNQFKLWDCEMSIYKSGDAVPNVGMADTYAVWLESPPDQKTCFLWVQEGTITNLMALQPIGGKSVFDKWGKFLGVGGEKLEAPSPGPVAEVMGILSEALGRPLEKAKNRVDDLLEEVEKQVEDLESAPSETIHHRFQLRTDYIVKFKLPADLTGGEAKRLATFLKTLPFDDEDD